MWECVILMKITNVFLKDVIKISSQSSIQICLNNISNFLIAERQTISICT